MNKPAAANTKILVGVLIASAVVIAVIAVIKLDALGTKGGGLGNDFKDALEKLAWIDPNLILYEESAQPIKTGFAKSHAIAVDSKGSIYVAGDNAVHIFAPNGQRTAEIALSATPTSLAPADDGKIYIALKDHLEVYSLAGNPLAKWERPDPNAYLTAIAVSKDDVFVADAGNSVVIRYDTSGTPVNLIGEKDPDRNIPGLVVPSAYFDLAVTKDGLLRVVNPGRLRIEAYTWDGDFEFSWGQSSPAIQGFCGCCNPVNIAMLSDGGFVTCEKGLTRVKIYDSEGVFLGVVAGPDQLLEPGTARVCEFPAQCQAGGFDVAVDAQGRVFVLDTIKNIVRIYTKKKAQ